MKNILLTALVFLSLVPRSRAAEEPVNGVIAIVNGTAITYKEVRQLIRPGLEQVARRYNTRPDLEKRERDRLFKSGVELLVETRLILAEYERAGYNLPENIINVQINREIRSKYGNRLTMMKTIQSEGLTWEAYRKLKREEFIVESMSGHFVQRDPLISPHKIETYYRENAERFTQPDQVKLRMITLLHRPGQDPAAPGKLAHEILAKLKEGAPFPEMAKIYSQDSLASEGGLKEWEDQKVLREEIAAKVVPLKKGDHSEVIETPEAVFIAYLEDVKAAGLKPLSEQRDEIERILKTQEKNRLHQKWIDGLKKKFYVTYF